jgi:hypothetical protein
MLNGGRNCFGVGMFLSAGYQVLIGGSCGTGSRPLCKVFPPLCVISWALSALMRVLGCCGFSMEDVQDNGEGGGDCFSVTLDITDCLFSFLPCKLWPPKFALLLEMDIQRYASPSAISLDI